jgi:hypothetical protein
MVKKMARYVTPREGAILGIVSNGLKKGIDETFIFLHLIDLGVVHPESKYDSKGHYNNNAFTNEGMRILKEWDKKQFSKRKDPVYILSNIKEMNLRVKSGRLDEQVRDRYIELYGNIVRKELGGTL